MAIITHIAAPLGLFSLSDSISPTMANTYTQLYIQIAVKRILRKFGYPPDMQMLATETVLKQAEMIANELTSQEQ